GDDGPSAGRRGASSSPRLKQAVRAGRSAAGAAAGAGTSAARCRNAMSWLILLSILEWSVRIGMTVVILRRRFSPPTSLAWLALIFFLPEVGLVVYLLVGVSYLGRRRARSHRQFMGVIRTPSRLAEMQAYIERPEV